MGEFITVIPVDGAIVLDPDQPRIQIPEEGARVRSSMYWDRMKKQGAVRFKSEDEKEASDDI